MIQQLEKSQKSCLEPIFLIFGECGNFENDPSESRTGRANLKPFGLQVDEIPEIGAGLDLLSFPVIGPIDFHKCRRQRNVL